MPSPSPASSPARPLGANPWFLAGLLALVTFAVYFPSLGGAVLWDDTGHVTKPELRSLDGLWRIWFQLGASQQYYPVLHSAFWVEHRLWGDATLGYHLVNILLHITSACLLAIVLTRVARPGATTAAPAPAPTGPLPWPWLAAFLFALHPVCVESVAWISEQKNTLSGVFYLLAVLAYFRFHDGLETSVDSSPWRRRAQLAGRYALATFLFFLALMSKTVTATLPAALLVILWWRQGRLRLRRDILPLVPWFALGGALGLFTAWVERNVVGAEGGSFELSTVQRGLVAGRAIWFYLSKLFCPVDLIFSYPHWTIDASAVWQFLFPLGVFLLLTALCIPIYRRGSSRATRAPLAGFLFFAGTLFPVLGFFNIYPFRFSYVADHFQYLASLGILSILAAGWGVLRQRHPQLLWLPVGVLAVFAGLSWEQSHMYQNEEVLFRTTLARNPDSWMSENNLGTLISKRPGGGPEALAHFRKALSLNPDYAQGHNNVGSELTKIPGHQDEAIDELNIAVRLMPTYAEARNNLGLALAQARRLDEAEAQFREAIRLDPKYSEAHNDLGITLGETGRLDEAVDEFRRAIELKPDYVGAYKNLAVAYMRSGHLHEAIAEFEELGRVAPDDPEVNRILQAIREHAGSLDGQ